MIKENIKEKLIKGLKKYLYNFSKKTGYYIKEINTDMQSVFYEGGCVDIKVNYNVKIVNIQDERNNIINGKTNGGHENSKGISRFTKR
jgi:hypothetical protein